MESEKTNNREENEIGDMSSLIPNWTEEGRREINEGKYSAGLSTLATVAKFHVKTYSVFPYHKLVCEISDEFREAMNVVEDFVWECPDRYVRKDAIVTYTEMLKIVVTEISALQDEDDRYINDYAFINKGINILEKLLKERVNEPETLTPGSEKFIKNIGGFGNRTRSVALEGLIKLAKYSAWDWNSEMYWRVINIIDKYLRETSDELLYTFEIDKPISNMSEIFRDLLKLDWDSKPEIEQCFIHFRDLLIYRGMKDSSYSDQNRRGAIEAFKKSFYGLDKNMSEEEVHRIYLPMIKFIEKCKGYDKESLQKTAVEILGILPNTKAFNKCILELFAFLVKLEIELEGEKLVELPRSLLAKYHFLGSGRQRSDLYRFDFDSDISKEQQIEIIDKKYRLARKEFKRNDSAENLVFCLYGLLPENIKSDYIEVYRHAVKILSSFANLYS